MSNEVVPNYVNVLSQYSRGHGVFSKKRGYIKREGQSPPGKYAFKREHKYQVIESM